MSEDLKNLSEIIELCQEELNKNDENITATLDLQDLKSLRNLINDYKRQVEINEEHQKTNGELIELIKKLEEDKKHYEIMILKDYISKFVIIEKIKEEKQEAIDSLERENERRHFYTVSVLQDLLEEGGKDNANRK